MSITTIVTGLQMSKDKDTKGTYRYTFNDRDANAKAVGSLYLLKGKAKETPDTVITVDVKACKPDVKGAFLKDKETKGTFRFTNNDRDGDAVFVGSFYLLKKAVTEMPEAIKIAIKK